MNCSVSFTSTIYLDRLQIGQLGMTVAQAYGHEQRHVISVAARVRAGVVDPMKSERGTFDDFNTCFEQAKTYEMKYESKFMLFLTTQIGSDHAGPSGGPLSPVNGAPYDPQSGTRQDILDLLR